MKKLSIVGLLMAMAVMGSACGERVAVEVVEPPETQVETPVETPVEEVETQIEAEVETPTVEPVITTETVKEEVEIPFNTVKNNDESLKKGKTTVVQKGIVGVETISYEVTYTDGVETGRKEVGREVTKKAVEEVIKVGVKVVASEPKPTPKPTPQTPKAEPIPDLGDEDIPEDELIIIPEPPAPPTEFTPDPEYGAVSFTLPTGTYKKWHWHSANIFYTGHLMDNGMLAWGWGYGHHSMTESKVQEWLPFAKKAFPKPDRAPSHDGEEVLARVFVWLP